MLDTLSGIMIFVSPLQLLKAFEPILVTPFGITMLFNSLQSQNAALPMLVTLSGMTMPVNFPQPLKAEPPMLVTPSGIVILVSSLRFANAQEPMLVTLPSLGITLLEHPTTNFLDAVSIRQFPTEWYTVLLSATVMLLNPLHFPNAEKSMLATPFPIETLVIPLQA